jgi:membrane protease YdiL (CAAX protease family)
MHHPRHDRAIAVASVRHERAALRRHNRDVTASPHSAASTWRRGVATLLPAVMPLAMKAVFRATTRRYGPERGYQAGFAIYWASCWAMAGTVVGPRRLLGLWQVPEQVLPAPRGLSAAVLVAPPLGGLATQWVPNARASGPVAGAVAAGVGTTNALAEEVFWRGVPVATFPDDPLRGWLWPAVGFTAWHLVPLTTRPSSLRRRAALLAGAASVGLGYGWIALRTRSLALVAPAHALTDSSGVVPVRANWLTGRP